MRTIIRSLFKSELHHLLVLVCGWGMFVFTHPSSAGLPHNALTIFWLGSALTSFLLLRSLGYFSTLRVLPRKSDVVFVFSSLPLAGIIVHVLLALLTGISVLPLNTILEGSLVIAPAFFLIHYGASHLLLAAGYRRKVILDVLPNERARIVNDLQELGPEAARSVQLLGITELREHILQGAVGDIDLIVLSHGASSKFENEGLVIRAHLAGVPIMDYLRLSSILPGRIRLSETDACTFMLAAVPQTVPMRTFTACKALLEPFIAIALGILLLPVILILAILIKCTSPGPIFYRQTRTGWLGRNFTLVKFRSMYLDAEAHGPQFSSKNDQRVTPLGRFMRNSRLDELPQLWNVLRGEMGFVGPRPERPEIYRELQREIPLFPLRTVVRPGITGWAQVRAGYAASITESHTKLEHDLFYIQNMSPRLDLVILFMTLIVAITGDKPTPVATPEISEVTVKKAS